MKIREIQAMISWTCFLFVRFSTSFTEDDITKLNLMTLRRIHCSQRRTIAIRDASNEASFLNWNVFFQVKKEIIKSFSKSDHLNCQLDTCFRICSTGLDSLKFLKLTVLFAFCVIWFVYSSAFRQFIEPLTHKHHFYGESRRVNIFNVSMQNSWCFVP